MRTTQTAIARLESGRLNPSLQTLRNYASANGYCLEVNFVAREASGEGTGAIVVVDAGPGEALTR
jgi:predicted transcriptional regulator